MRRARPPRRAANLFFGCTASPAKRHKPHRFPAQLCEQDFDAYECSVISDDTMQAVGAGIPRRPSHDAADHRSSREKIDHEGHLGAPPD